MGASNVYAQTRVTVNGTIVDPSGNPAISGTVIFQLMPNLNNVQYTIAGQGVLAPLSSTCGINASGVVQNIGLSGPCLVWGNDVISPGGTTYTVTTNPNGQFGSTVQQQCISGAGPYDMTRPNFCGPFTIKPQYSVQTAAPWTVNQIPQCAGCFNIGTASLPWGSIFANNLFVNSINGLGNVQYANGFSGANCGAQVVACLAKVITNGGGVCDASMMNSCSLTQEVDIGNGSTTSALLLVPNYGTWTWSGIIDGTSCGIKQFSGSSVRGFGSLNGVQKLRIQTSGTVSMASMLCTDTNPLNGGQYLNIDLNALVIPSAGATFTAPIVNYQRLFDGSYVRNMTISMANVTNSTGFALNSACCGAAAEKIVVDAGNSTGNQPCLFSTFASGAGSSALSLKDFSCDHAGSTVPEIIVNQGSSTPAMINFYNTYVEGNTTVDPTVPHVDIVHCIGCNFFGITIHRERSGDTQYGITNENNAGNFINIETLGGTGLGSSNMINDLVAGKIVSYSGASVTTTTPHFSTTDTSVRAEQGTTTLSGGAGTATFAVAFQVTPVCNANDQTANASVKAAPSLTNVVFTGTGTDVIAWTCRGNPN